jgi:hypothetical protein
MTPDVIAVKARLDYTLEVQFADGETRRFDMAPYLDYPAFSELREANVFFRAKVLNGTVAWTDDIDLSPDTVYLKGERVRGGEG